MKPVKEKTSWVPAPLPPLEEAPWVPPPVAPEDVPASGGGLAKKIWQTLTGTTSGGGGYPRAELPMHCGVHNRPFIVVAELRGNVLFLVDNKISDAAPASGGGFGAAPGLLGKFQVIDAARHWRCLHCGTRDNPILKTHILWFCCDKLICAGSIGRSAYCACGRLAERSFTFAKFGEGNWNVSGHLAASSAPKQGARSLPPPPRLLPGPPRESISASENETTPSCGITRAHEHKWPLRQLPPPARRLPPPNFKRWP